MIDSGYILVDRGVWTHPALDTDDPMSPREAWIRLVGEAAFKDHAGLKRGQLRVGMRALAVVFGWLTSDGEPDKERVRTFLRKLERNEMIQRSQGVTTIVNYDRYQARDRSETEHFQGSSNGHPPSHPVATPIPTPWPPHDAAPIGVRGTHGHPVATPAPAPCPPPLPPYENQGSRTKTKDSEEHQTRERAPSALPWQDPAADLTTKAGRAKAYPATLPSVAGRSIYPDWFDAAWAARANQRAGDAKRAAWKLARKLVVDGALTPDELLRRTQAYAATEPAERQKYLQGYRRWFGESVAEYEPTRITPTVSHPTQRVAVEEPDYDDIASPSDFAPGELESLIPFGRRSSAA